MKIVVIGINYYPEITATGLYTTGMCEWFVRHGHEVHVITGFPYYPEWKKYANYSGKVLVTENINGVNVHRSYLYVPSNVSSKFRIVHEASFIASCAINILRCSFLRPDVAICISPPFGLGIYGPLFSGMLAIPYVYHIQDLQLDAAVDLGMIKNNILVNLLRRCERILLQKADLVTTISRGMLERIISKGIGRDKVGIVPNWSTIKLSDYVGKSNEFRKMNNIAADRFVVLYSGNMGEKQGLESVVESAKLLRKEEKILFLLVGDGVKKNDLIQKVNKWGLKNVWFLQKQPSDILPQMLCAADICLVPQQKDISDIVMPSKLTNILSCGKPALVSANDSCEVAKVVRSHRCGIVIRPEDPAAMAETVMRLEQDRPHLSEIGNNGRLYADKYLAIDKILTGFEDKLIGLRSVRKGAKEAMFGEKA